MNDLQSLHAALAQDDPSQDVADRSRHRLQNRIAGGPGPRRRTNWLAVGTGVTAAAAAAAVAISVLPGSPPAGNPSANTGDAAPTRTVTAQQVLLAAATAAEQTTEGSGDYWNVHVNSSNGDGTTDVWDYWTGMDGQTWYADRKSDGKALPLGDQAPKPFDLFGVGLTLEELRALPTDPEALKTWVHDTIANGPASSSAGPLRDTPKLLAQAQFDSLLMLVSTLPAPPEVRAAAFRALATYPDVQSLGDVPGGQGLVLPGGERFVVDSSTGQVTRTSSLAMNGATYSVPEPGSIEVITGWTDTLPR
jgi:hypothetical protein